MTDVDNLTDAELRAKLIEYGFPVMPITGTTRKVMMKKLKLLLDNSSKITNSGNKDRRSLGRFSSDDDSDSDQVKAAAAAKKNRRVTMAAPLQMRPPATQPRKVADAPEAKREIKTTTTTTRTSKILLNAANATAKDEFDTGSESDEVESSFNSSSNNNGNTAAAAGEFRRKTLTTSPLSASNKLPSSFLSASSAADAAYDRLAQIRSRYSSGYERPLYTSSPTVDARLEDKKNTPFLSNFTRELRELSQLRDSPRSSSGGGGSSANQEYRSQQDVIKESDANGAKGYLSSYRTTARGRTGIYDRSTAVSNQSSILKNNMVPFLVLLVAFLFFIVVAVVYLGIRSDTGLEVSARVPVCAVPVATGKPIDCVPSGEEKPAKNLFKVLKPELNKRGVAYWCNRGDAVDATATYYMTQGDVIDFITRNYALKNHSQIVKDLYHVQLLSFFNPEWGLSVVLVRGDQVQTAKNMEQVVTSGDAVVVGIMSSRPPVPWSCSIYNALSTVISLVTSLVVGVAILYCLNYAYKHHKSWQRKQRDEEAAMVENIIDILQSNCGGRAEEKGDEQGGYMVINHVRDMIIPVTERKRGEQIWKRAVKFIEDNESRVRTEVQVVRGEPFEVWRWLGGPNVSVNKSWQGQAFDTQMGSVNSLVCSPTPCLKIRGMLEDGDRNTHVIKKAILSKCGPQCRILHCGIDPKTNCVYLKMADTGDAAVAYTNMHGWWFAGNLVSAKYLRLERYMQRFPESPVTGPPFLQ